MVNTKTKNILLLLTLLGITIGFTTTTTATDVSSSITSMLEFDTLGFSSSNGYYNATAVGGATLSPNGKIGNGSLLLNGAGKMINWGNVPLNASVTINLWINLSSKYGTDGARQPIFARGGSPTRPMGFNLIDSGDTDKLAHYVGDGTGQLASSGNVDLHLPVGRYFMLTLVKTGTDYAIYTDGNLNVTLTNAHLYSDANNTLPLYFGGVNGWAGWGEMLASLDQIVIYNRSLAAADITELYNSGAGMSYATMTTPPATPFLITAKSAFNQTTINEFNATIDGTTYGTKNGTISTPINQTSHTLHTIKIYRTFFNQTDFTSFNTSANLQANLSLNLYNNETCTQTYTSLYVGNTIRYYCEFYYANTSSNLSGNITEMKVYSIIRNVQDNRINTTFVNITNTTSPDYSYYYQNYTINLTDFSDELRQNTQLCSRWGCQNLTSTNLITQNSINYNLLFYVYNYLGQLVNDVSIYILGYGLSSNDNPYSVTATTFINNTNNSNRVSFNISDTGAYNLPALFNITINNTVNYYNFTLTPTYLHIIFFNQNNASAYTSGFISNSQKSEINFTANSTLAIQEAWGDGLVVVRFHETNGYNSSQYYEYINNGSAIYEEMMLLDDNVLDWTQYIKVMSGNQNEIKGAKIRAYSTRQINGSTYSSNGLIDQRLTSSKGMTSITADYDTQLWLEISKEGYVTETRSLVVGTEDYTEANPYVIHLTEDRTSHVFDGLIIHVQPYFTNRTSNIYGYVETKPTSTLVYTTDYLNATSLFPFINIINNNWDPNKGNGIYNFTLRPNIEYDATTLANITLYFLVDNRYPYYYTITYVPKNYTNVLIIPTNNVNNLSIRFILWISIIFLAFGAGILFKTDDASIIAFELLSIGILFTGYGIYPVAIAIIVRYVLRTVHRVVSE